MEVRFQFTDADETQYLGFCKTEDTTAPSLFCATRQTPGRCALSSIRSSAENILTTQEELSRRASVLIESLPIYNSLVGVQIDEESVCENQLLAARTPVIFTLGKTKNIV